MTVPRQWPSYLARRSAALTGGIDVELFERAGSRVELAFTSCCRDTCRTRGVTRKRQIELSSGQACPPCYCEHPYRRGGNCQQLLGFWDSPPRPRSSSSQWTPSNHRRGGLKCCLRTRFPPAGTALLAADLPFSVEPPEICPDTILYIAEGFNSSEVPYLPLRMVPALTCCIHET